jgi:dihydroorotate dehydrogenase (NAD+) catalytic subunit
MMTETTFFGVPLKNRSVLASGILGVTAASLARVYREGAALVTSKSIGPSKRKGHNSPVVFDWGGGLLNAVGLSNPGIDDFVAQYERIPIDFPVIISIYGEKEEDFPLLVNKLKRLKYDYIELNLSCPNVSDEFGTPFAFSHTHTANITKRIKHIADKPVIVKLSPNTPDIVDVARGAERAGADAICVINTVGPGMIINTNTGAPLLGNRWGGISGQAILPLTVRIVYELYRSVNIPIIGTGGISSIDCALQVLMAGATLYGIGSAVYQKGLTIFREIDTGIRKFLIDNKIKDSAELIGLSHKSKQYAFYRTEQRDKGQHHYRSGTRFTVLPVILIEKNASNMVQTVFFDAEQLIDQQVAKDDSSAGVKIPKPGQFYMLWIPGVNQKPYSVSYYDGKLIGFTCKRRGCFSEKMFNLKSGDPVGLLGPLGKGFELRGDNYLLVGGGIGCAPLVFSAMKLLGMGKKTTLLCGGESILWVDWVEPLLRRGMSGSIDVIHYCTEDGTLGKEGMITDHLDAILHEVGPKYAIVCGPELLTKKSIHLLKNNGIDGQASIERMMKCGIGVCGSCSVDHTGDRVCVEGPVFDFQYLEKMREYGSYAMDESGAIIGNQSLLPLTADSIRS